MLSIEAENPITCVVTNIQVDYINPSIRCIFYLSTSHLIKKCSALHGFKREPRKVTPPAQRTSQNITIATDSEWRVSRQPDRIGFQAF